MKGILPTRGFRTKAARPEPVSVGVGVSRDDAMAAVHAMRERGYEARATERHVRAHCVAVSVWVVTVDRSE